MKRTFLYEMKRSANYQTVGITEGFEGEFSTDKDYLAECSKVTEAVKKKVTEELNKLSDKKVSLDV